MRRCSLLALALVASGCGLDGYEARMIDSQNRAKRYEEEKDLLEAPLTIPSPPNQDGVKTPVANAFFRAPKGINGTTSNELNPRGGRLYTYHPRAEKSALPFVFVELAFGEDRKEFAGEVMQTFPAANVQWKPREVSISGRPPVTFNSAEFEDDRFFYSINLVRTGNGQAAVCYWLDKATRGSGQRALTASLESFATGEEVKARQALFSRGSPLESVSKGSK